METVYDWLTVLAFAELAVLFLQRSSEEAQTDTIWHYLPPAAGCMMSNWLGNEGYAIPAVLALFATLAYIILVLRPHWPGRRS